MAFASLKVEADEPGRRLVLAGGEFPAIPKRVAVIASALALLMFSIPAIANLVALLKNGASIGGVLDLVFSAFLPLGVAAVLLAAGRGTRLIRRLAADRASDRLEITEFRVLGGSLSPDVIPFADLSAMTVSAGVRPGGPRSTAAYPVKLRLRFREETRRPPRALQLFVAGLDKKEEAGDLGLRLASVIGFEYQRVVRNDPRAVELEFATLGAPGFVPLAATLAKADYARDQVSQPAEALLARESTPAFDPASLKSEARVALWQPGQQVRFYRPLGLPAIGCLPGVLLFAAGPLAFWSSGRTGTNTLGDQVLVGLIAGLFGVVFGTVSAVGVYTSLPRTVELDWLEQRLRVRGLLRQSDYDFAQVRSIEMKCVALRTSRGRGSSSYTNYLCKAIANVGEPGGKTKAVEILSTRGDRDPDVPYRTLLPLVSDLAKALGVARVTGNYA